MLKNHFRDYFTQRRILMKDILLKSKARKSGSIFYQKGEEKKLTLLFVFFCSNKKKKKTRYFFYTAINSDFEDINKAFVTMSEAR